MLNYNMTNEDFEILVEKAIKNAPEWLTQDLESIIKKKNSSMRIGYIISELYSKYTFGIKHIATAMTQNTEWSVLAHDRLNFIDNNIDLIYYMIKKYKS